MCDRRRKSLRSRGGLWEEAGRLRTRPPRGKGRNQGGAGRGVRAPPRQAPHRLRSRTSRWRLPPLPEPLPGRCTRARARGCVSHPAGHRTPPVTSSCDLRPRFLAPSRCRCRVPERAACALLVLPRPGHRKLSPPDTVKLLLPQGLSASCSLAQITTKLFLSFRLPSHVRFLS